MDSLITLPLFDELLEIHATPKQIGKIEGRKA
jgi:hypothetical protein